VGLTISAIVSAAFLVVVVASFCWLLHWVGSVFKTILGFYLGNSDTSSAGVSTFFFPVEYCSFFENTPSRKVGKVSYQVHI